jgi:hypothetical protein
MFALRPNTREGNAKSSSYTQDDKALMLYMLWPTRRSSSYLQDDLARQRDRYKIGNVNMCARVSWRPTRSVQYNMNGTGRHTRRQAGGVRCARVPLELNRRVMPTSGLIRYMTIKAQEGETHRRKKYAQRGGPWSKLPWLCAAWTCASGGGAVRPQTGMTTPIMVNRFPSTRRDQNGQSPV